MKIIEDFELYEISLVPEPLHPSWTIQIVEAEQ